jgi:hypothetical protein
MKFSIDVRDVNDGIVTATSVYAVYNQPKPGGKAGEKVRIVQALTPGVVSDLPLADPTVSFGVAAGDFADEAITLSEVDGRWLTDSPAGSVTKLGELITLKLTVGCISLAPTVALPPEFPVKDNPQAVLVDAANGGSYRGVENGPENFRRFNNPFTFPDLDAAGWNRYGSDTRQVDLNKSGTFILLEYGFKAAVRAGKNPRFLIAVWAPRIALGPIPQVMMLFSPPTIRNDYAVDSYPFRGAYPYAAYAGKPPAPPATAIVVQPPYPTLPARYLVNHKREPFKIVHQLLSAGRNPIVIMPIQPSMNWGPLACQRGSSRLMKEVVRFLYSRQLVSSLTTPTAKFSLSGGNASVFPSRGLFTRETIPQKFTVTVAGFSEGIDAVLAICSPNKDLDAKLYDPALFAAPPDPLVNGWRELWDIDGVAADHEFTNPKDPKDVTIVKGADRHLNTLRNWLKTSRRTIRSYHSGWGFRSQPRGLIEPARLVRLPKTLNKVWVEHGTSADGRVSYIHFSDPAINDFGISDAHHTVLGTAFGHAAQFPLP